MNKLFTVAIISAIIGVGAARADDEMPVVMDDAPVVADADMAPAADITVDDAPAMDESITDAVETMPDTAPVAEPVAEAPAEPAPAPVPETPTDTVAPLNIAECEQMATGADGDTLVKCPIGDGWDKIQRQKADTTFASAGDGYGTSAKQRMMADREHMYINIGTGDECASGTAYRVLVKNIIYSGKNLYATKYCAQ